MLRSPVARAIACLLILVSVILLTDWPTLGNRFVNWDDQEEITQNPDFKPPVTLEKLKWNWSNTRLTLYMPVTYYVWGAVAAIWSRDFAAAFHALNLALHCICSALVFLLVLQLLGRPGPALLGALVFAVHPLAVEPVAWASGMYTVLSCCFCLGALIAYVAYVRRKEMRTSNFERRTSNVEVAESPSSFRSSKFAFFILATTLYAFALLTKAASVSLPLAAAAIDLFILNRPLGRVVRSLSLWVILAIPIVVTAKLFQDVSAITAPPLWERPIVALDAMGFYCRKIFFPVGLIPDYGRNPAWVMHHLLFALLTGSGAICVLLVAWLQRRRNPSVTAGLVVFIAGIGPYLGLTAFDFQYVSTVADRYAYFGLVGVAIVVAGECARHRFAPTLVLGGVLVCALISHWQTELWHDTDTLFGYTLRTNPRSLISHNVLGFMAAKSGRRDEAEHHYQAALEIWPEDATIHFDLGNLYRESQPQRAKDEYELAVRYQPNYVIYRNGLAAVLARLNDPIGAMAQWQRAIAIDPDYIDARNNVADMCMDGHPEIAWEQYHAVLKLDPANEHAIAKLAELAKQR